MSDNKVTASTFLEFAQADSPETEYSLICEACEYLEARGIIAPEVGIVLGSGLGSYTENLKDMIRVPYTDIPGFAQSTAPSHEGALYYGEHLGRKLIVMSGRFHYYEGWPMRAVIFPVRVMAKLGISRLILTNAAGSINLDFPAGSLMLITDHINMSGNNPLIGPNLKEFGVRFPDMTHGYNAEIRESIKAKALEQGIDLHEGVYVMMSGPSFESPAEIRFLRTIGADAVGMSTVPEAIAANHAGLDVVGISCLANAAAGITDNPLTSEEVNEAANAISETIVKVVNIAINA